MPNRQLAVIARGHSWVLLDEAASELGLFESRGEALAKACEHVRRLAEPRYVLVQDETGWRETLLRPLTAD